MNRNLVETGQKWVETAGWDIEARRDAGVTPSELPRMLQSMLAERFRVEIRRETQVRPIFALTVSKGGAKLLAGDGKGGMSAGPTTIRFASGTMAELANQLTSYLGRQVMDRTDLNGEFAIHLSFAPVDPGALENESGSAPSLFRALQEQAGLNLESTKGPVQVLVVNRAEKPSAN